MNCPICLAVLHEPEPNIFVCIIIATGWCPNKFLRLNAQEINRQSLIYTQFEQNPDSLIVSEKIKVNRSNSGTI